MTNDEALKIFKDSGAYMEGHFLLTSGRHSNAYVEKFNMLQRPEYCTLLCQGLADKFRHLKPDLVVGLRPSGASCWPTKRPVPWARGASSWSGKRAS